MKLSTKGRYAMLALTDLALAPKGELTTLSHIAERQDVSLPYLEQLFVKLRRAGLVEAVRGPGGGYRLAHSPDAIRITQVLEAVEENVDALHTGAGASGGKVARLTQPHEQVLVSTWCSVISSLGSGRS